MRSASVSGTWFALGFAGAPKHGADCLGFAEPSGYVDGGAIGQRHYGPDPRNRHQAPAHLIVPHDGQQAAMQDDDLFAKYPPDNEQWLDQRGQVGEVLDQLLDPRLEPESSPSTSRTPRAALYPRLAFIGS